MPPSKPATVLHYTVKGGLPFPIDMLRYDACWPADESDSHLIERSIRDETGGIITVGIDSRRPLTVERWHSFGWKVESGVRA